MAEPKESRDVNTFRKKWDKEYFAKRALEREKLEAEEVEPEKDHPAHKDYRPDLPRLPLKARDYEVTLDSQLGKSVALNAATPLSQQGGYYCDVCDCVVKDSANFLDHINGKKHLRALGYSMRTERSSLEQVRQRLQMGKRKKEEERKKYDFEDRMERLREEEERRKQERKERKRRKKDGRNGESSNTTTANTTAPRKDDENDHKTEREEKEDEEKREEEEEDEETRMLAAMGLPTGFGGSVKT
ncbi:zinc finger, matrin-type 2 [Balamuthia mandrillaris]